MSEQVLLQGKLLGIEEFLQVPAPAGDDPGVSGAALICGRSQWIALLSEILPRALLAELSLAPELLGSSGGGQFLVVLPGESRDKAGAFLSAAAAGVTELSSGVLRLVWASTENLGDWAVVRRRLADEMNRQRSAPAAGSGNIAELFAPYDPPASDDAASYFTETLNRGLRQATHLGYSAATPGRVLLGEGDHQWPIGGTDGIPLARHAALGADEVHRAAPGELARRAEGRPGWGVLRGDADNLEGRIRRLATIEEHVQLSVMYKQFFAGEIEVVCSMPQFWQKVSVIYTGGDDFAVYGSWDALILLAQEIQRLFHRFHESSLKEVPGSDGKTISMGLAFAPEPDTPLVEVYRTAGDHLRMAKAAHKDRLYVFGRAVEWRHLAHAVTLKDNLSKMVRDHGFPPAFLEDMMRFYQDQASGAASRRFDRPWRYHRRLWLWAPGARDREFQRLLTRLIRDLIGKDAAHAQLRPAGGIALEWAKLLTSEA